MTYRPSIPNGVSELMDHLGMMMLRSPTFRDDYFVDQNVETVFFELNAGLKLIERKVGEEKYRALVALSDEMRAHFEADPDDVGRALQGRELILEMEAMLKGRS